MATTIWRLSIRSIVLIRRIGSLDQKARLF
jgi:hypothetical protein